MNPLVSLRTMINGMHTLQALNFGLQNGFFKILNQYSTPVPIHDYLEASNYDSQIVLPWVNAMCAAGVLLKDSSDRISFAEEWKEPLLNTDSSSYVGNLPRCHLAIADKIYSRMPALLRRQEKIAWSDLGKGFVSDLTADGIRFANYFVNESLNQMPGLCEKLEEGAFVFDVGCGVMPDLAKSLVEMDEISEITCIDYPVVVKEAEKNFSNPKLSYISGDLTDLKVDSQWDVVVLVNVALSEDHSVNRKILEFCKVALKPGGTIIALFPTVFCVCEIGHITKRSDLIDNVDLGTSSFHEPTQGVRQIFYTPLRLRQLLIQTGFKTKQFELVFYDSPVQLEQGKRIYDLQDDDLVLYEHYILAEKR